MEDKIYNVYERKDKGDEQIAQIQCDKVTGPEADRVFRLLKECGWPKETPERVLHGSYLWAELAQK